VSLVCPHCHREFKPATEPLTARQLAVLRWIEDYIRVNGVAPTFTEIATGMRYASLSSVHEHLMNLERKGVLLRTYNAERGITLLVRSDELGAIAPASDGETSD